MLSPGQRPVGLVQSMIDHLEVDQTIMKINCVRPLGAHKNNIRMSVNQVFRSIYGQMPCVDSLVPIRVVYFVHFAHQRSELELTKGLFLFHESVHITA
jgi:hypothetical protein